MAQINYVPIGNIIVAFEIVDPKITDKANARIQKNIDSMRLRPKFLRNQAKARITASQIILNC